MRAGSERPPPVLDGVSLVCPPPGTFIPPRTYLSPAVFELEMSEVFPRSWVFVGDTTDLAKPGDFFTTEVGYEPVVVVRSGDSSIRAFSNVCPHRAALVATGTGNCGARLRCPYHGWSFALDGSLAAAPLRGGFDGTFEPEHLGLRSLRLDVWGPFVFVNLSGDAPPLDEWLEGAPAAMADHELEHLPRRHRVEDEVDVNWKVLVDNGICGYHPLVVHPQSLCRTPFEEPRGRAGRTTASVTITATEPPAIGVKDGLRGAARGGSVIYDVFPNFVVSASPSGSVNAYWWRPLAVDRSLAGTAGYSSHEHDPRLAPDLVRQVQDEDYAICRRVQAGLRSRLYQPGPQHELELRVHAFQRWVMGALADAASDGDSLSAGQDSMGGSACALHSSQERS